MCARSTFVALRCASATAGIKAEATKSMTKTRVRFIWQAYTCRLRQQWSFGLFASEPQSSRYPDTRIRGCPTCAPQMQRPTQPSRTADPRRQIARFTTRLPSSRPKPRTSRTIAFGLLSGHRRATGLATNRRSVRTGYSPPTSNQAAGLRLVAKGLVRSRRPEIGEAIVGRMRLARERDVRPDERLSV